MYTYWVVSSVNFHLDSWSTNFIVSTLYILITKQIKKLDITIDCVRLSRCDVRLYIVKLSCIALLGTAKSMYTLCTCVPIYLECGLSVLCYDVNVMSTA